MAKVIFKTKPSLAKIFKKEINELGFDVSSLNTDEDIIHAYCSYSYRLIEKRPRIIHKAGTFACPDEVKKGLEWFEEKIRNGESLNPHLNSATKKDKLDGLLYDWGIHHFHLGEEYAAPGFVKRTGYVLFAIVKPDDVFFIDIRDHVGWSDKTLLEIVHRNWPHLLSPFRMEGVRPKYNASEKDIADFRKSGINTIIELSDSNSYISMGGGITAAGTSMEAVGNYIKLMREFSHIEDEIRANAGKQVENVMPKGHPFRDKNTFVFMCKREKDLIRFYDVVNNKYWQNCLKLKALKSGFEL